MNIKINTLKNRIISEYQRKPFLYPFLLVFVFGQICLGFFSSPISAIFRDEMFEPQLRVLKSHLMFSYVLFCFIFVFKLSNKLPKVERAISYLFILMYAYITLFLFVFMGYFSALTFFGSFLYQGIFNGHWVTHIPEAVDYMWKILGGDLNE